MSPPAFTIGGLAAASSGAGFDIALTDTGANNVALTVGSNNASTVYAGTLSGGGSLNKVKFRKDANFGFEVPVEVPGVDATLLDPKATWADKAAYDAQAAKLVKMFSDNFGQYLPHVDTDVKAAAIG